MNCLLSVAPALSSSCVQNARSMRIRRPNELQGQLFYHGRFLRVALVLGFALLAVAAASAQVRFGSVAIGSSASQTVSFDVSDDTTVSSVQVLTMGVQGLDFQPGGTFNCGDGLCKQPVTFSPLYPGLRAGAVVAFDSTGKVMGATYISGIGTGGLGVLIPGTIKTVAGDGDWKSEGDDEPAISTELFLPSAVALDGSGNLYIADSSHDRIRIVCAATGTVFPGIDCRQIGYIYTVAGTAGSWAMPATASYPPAPAWS